MIDTEFNSVVQINLYNLFTMKVALAGSRISGLTVAPDGQANVGTHASSPNDYLGDPRSKLDHAVRDLVERHTGRRPPRAVRVLTPLRSFGHYFNLARRASR